MDGELDMLVAIMAISVFAITAMTAYAFVTDLDWRPAKRAELACRRCDVCNSPIDTSGWRETRWYERDCKECGHAYRFDPRKEPLEK